MHKEELQCRHVLSAKYCQDDKITEDEMAAGKHEGQARQYMGELVGDGRMILKQTSKEYNERIWIILKDLFHFTYNKSMVIFSYTDYKNLY